MMACRLKRLFQFFTLGALLAVLGRTQTQQLPDITADSKESLRGLPGVSVNAGQLNCEGIIDPALAKQDMEVKLRVAGITVTTLPFAGLNLNATCMPVMIGDRRFATVISFTLGVSQVLWLPPQPVRVTLGTVWETGTLLYCGGGTKCDDYFRSQLRDYTDKFINDFLTVNPKR